MTYRGLIHFHSQYSYDSILSIKRIINFAMKEKINFLILTDHDTIQGSEALKEYVQKYNYPIEVLVSAEYYTEYGDVIALGINKEITNMKFNSFVKLVREQNGLLLFPHPYKGHSNIEIIAKNADLIEVFNARTDDMSNIKALNLAKKFKKPIYYATDAHNYKSLKNCIIEFDKNGSFIESLKNSKINATTFIKSYDYEIIISQLIKAYKNKDFNLFRYLLKSTLYKSAKLKLLDKV